MRVLVACEFSGVVTAAFRARGAYAWSCDLLPTEGNPDYHMQCDVSLALKQCWDLLIAFPPCTHLAASGARWWPLKRRQQMEAMDFVRLLMKADVERIAIENPVGKISTDIRKPNQIIQPWQFGHGETKATCLWLKNLPCLVPTKIVEGREARIHRMSPSKDRSRNRSRTYSGVAEAMAEQWA